MNTPAGYTRVHTHTRTRMRAHTYITTIREHAQQPSSDTDQAPTHKTPSRSQTQPNRATPQSAAAERKVCLLRRRQLRLHRLELALPRACLDAIRSQKVAELLKHLLEVTYR